MKQWYLALCLPILIGRASPLHAKAEFSASKSAASSERREEDPARFGWRLGGFYTTGSTYCSAVVNPLTGGLTCPTGFAPYLLVTSVCNTADSAARATYLCVDW